MSLSATRSRRSNAGNKWAEALAALQLENGDALDPDAEAPGEEFIGKEEEDVFESDFESTDEEEYAMQGIEDSEKQVQVEERAERRAARAKASKSGAAPTQKILERAMKGRPAPKKKSTSTKSTLERKPSIWDTTRQSERASTVKHKFQVQERLKDAEKRKARTHRRPRLVTAPKTQDELIAAALELEEKNTKALNEYLEKEEEKRAAARRVVRLKIEGPVVRWLSRGEVPLVEEVGQERETSGTLVVPSQGRVQAPATPAPLVQTPLVQIPANQPAEVQVPVVHKASPVETSFPIAPEGSSASILTSTPTPGRASTPLRTQRMQVYVEIPTSSKSMRGSLSSPSTQGSLVSREQESSSAPLAYHGSSVSSQSLVRAPLSSTVSLPRSPLSTFEPLVSEGDSSKPLAQVPNAQPSQSLAPLPHCSESVSLQHLGPTLPTPPQPNPARTPHRPTAVRQSSASSSGSTKSKGRMVMYVEIPVCKKDKGETQAPDPVETLGPSSGGLLLEPSSDPPAPVSSAPPGHSVPDLAKSSMLTLPSSSAPGHSPPGPTPTPYTPSRPARPSPPQKEARNYVIVEYGGGARASFGWNMQAVFGNHADWGDILINGIKAPHPVKPVCAITGLPASYRDSRTGIPYANAYAYKTLTRLLSHEFIWSKERGCYVGDEGQDPARSVPAGWRSAAAGRF
ncbi:hypothetical protein OPQ81_009317 [Rhizoctonia solani]|nr:hypothetical protein OPQ81_009317 [Rhizoctonia solani]